MSQTVMYNCRDIQIPIGQGVQVKKKVLLVYIDSTTISWASRKRKSVALNTVEAEYIAACDACTEAVWLRKLVFGLFDQALDSTVIIKVV
jgi:hypothetical protein